MTVPAVAAPSLRRHTVRFFLRMGLAMIGANVAAAAALFVYLVFLLPQPDGAQDRVLLNTIVGAAYVGGAVLLGSVATVLTLRRLLRWLRPGHVLDDADRTLVVQVPSRVVRLYATAWASAAVVFGALSVADGWAAALIVAASILVGGMTTSALSYLLAEPLVRPLVAVAMRGREEPPPVVLGVRRRILLAWSLGTAVPLLALVVGVLDPSGDRPMDDAAVVYLAVTGLVVGLVTMSVTARSVSDPVSSVTAALRRVGDGDLGVTVEVDDVSEVGRLQSGFNAMVEGLRERDRLHDLFGRQVGPEAAAVSLRDGVRLGGERREVAVLFVDVIGSTAMAVQTAPEEVVRLLNTFFGVVVEVVEAHGGWVNKFEGDAALCLFGAPVARADAAACALAAARRLGERLAPLALDAAVGVSAGAVVAGHVGAESRFEYTVIGDPVNAAARLTDLAKARPGRVLADAAVVRAAGPEAECWRSCGQAVLRGRHDPTELACPVGPPGPG